jgi:hypothetical protein
MTILLFAGSLIATLSVITAVLTLVVCSKDTAKLNRQIDVLEATVELQEQLIVEQAAHLVALFHRWPVAPVSGHKVFAKITIIDVWPN